MARLTKKQKAHASKLDASKHYDLSAAIKLVKDCATAKFDETVDIVINTGVDPRQTEQNVRGMVSMPHGTGKTIKVAVFARGDKAAAATEAGADYVGAEDLAEKIAGGMTDFDRCIATPDMMAVVGRLGKVLGPKGLMPNPKLGTVTPNAADAVKAAKSGQVEFRTDKGAVIHAGIGKASFSDEALVENIKAFLGAVTKSKPSGVKGNYIRKIGLSSTMGQSVKVDLTDLAA